MSCKFCKSFDFTSIAVKDNSICSAVGSSRFTDTFYKGKHEYQLFSYCPICGANLCYYTDANNVGRTTVVVAVDDKGDRIPFAVDASDSVLSEEAYSTICDLRADTGCSFSMAKQAYDAVKRDGKDYGAMLAYCNTFIRIQNFRKSAALFHELMEAE